MGLSRRHQYNALVSILLLTTWTSEAFHVLTTSGLPHSSKWRKSTNLWMAKKRRGKLGSIVSSEDSVRSRSTPTSRKSSSRQSRRPSNDAAAVSPALAEWASMKEKDEVPSGIQPVEIQDEEVDVSSSFERFTEDTRISRKSSSKKQNDAEVEAFISQELKALEKALDADAKSTLDEILSPIRSILANVVPRGTLRPALAGSKKINYRLAWVGSDDAICHIGTGLHKAPLARLQEVFLCCLGRSKIELLEVIRVIGPFPNVKNVLSGTAKISRHNQNDDVSELEIVYGTMLDGMGKEIKAGGRDSFRKFELQILLGDENVILAVVPPEDGSLRKDPLEDNGANLLVFVRENEMDDKLVKYRVSEAS